MRDLEIFDISKSFGLLYDLMRAVGRVSAMSIDNRINRSLASQRKDTQPIKSLSLNSISIIFPRGVGRLSLLSNFHAPQLYIYLPVRFELDSKEKFNPETITH